MLSGMLNFGYFIGSQVVKLYEYFVYIIPINLICVHIQLDKSIMFNCVCLDKSPESDFINDFINRNM